MPRTSTNRENKQRQAREKANKRHRAAYRANPSVPIATSVYKRGNRLEVVWYAVDRETGYSERKSKRFPLEKHDEALRFIDARKREARLARASMKDQKRRHRQEEQKRRAERREARRRETLERRRHHANQRGVRIDRNIEEFKDGSARVHWGDHHSRRFNPGWTLTGLQRVRDEEEAPIQLEKEQAREERRRQALARRRQAYVPETVRAIPNVPNIYARRRASDQLLLGYLVIVRVVNPTTGKTRQRLHRFPVGTSLQDMVSWRDATGQLVNAPRIAEVLADAQLGRKVRVARQHGAERTGQKRTEERLEREQAVAREWRELRKTYPREKGRKLAARIAARLGLKENTIRKDLVRLGRVDP